MIEEFKLYKITNNRRHGTIYWYVSNLGNIRKNNEDYKLTKKYKYYRFANILVHRAVAELFIGQIPDGYEVDHIDGNHYNNCINNLRIVTHKDNMNNIITKNKISNNRIGKSNGPFSNKTKYNMSKAHKGRKIFCDENGNRHYKFI